MCYKNIEFLQYNIEKSHGRIFMNMNRHAGGFFVAVLMARMNIWQQTKCPAQGNSYISFAMNILGKLMQLLTSKLDICVLIWEFLFPRHILN